MRHLTIFAAIAVCAFVGATTPVSAQSGLTALTARIAESGGLNRIEIDMSDRAAFRAFALTNPDRLVFDFPKIAWRLEAPRPGPDVALIDGVRFGLRRGGGRMVIDLRAPARIDSAYTEEADGATPARFVATIAPETAENFAAGAGWPPDVAPERTAADALKRDVMIVIDPGHGGKDIGAVAGDLAESHLMLDYAQRLARAIEARSGYAAALTRTEDEFLTLRQRVDIARAKDADVFISLHADSLEQGVATGASIFTLSEEATSKEAAELADTLNRADDLAGAEVAAAETDVTRVLIAFAQRATFEQSQSLAMAMVEALDGRTPILKDRAIQSAGFRVLKAPDVPSILLELGFLSSPRDRERLLSEEGRQALIQGIAEGVFAWVEAQEGERYAPARRARGG